jgi:hypothetical protein
LVKVVQEKTAIDTNDVRPLSQPWMYIFLLIVTCFLLLIDSKLLLDIYLGHKFPFTMH